MPLSVPSQSVFDLRTRRSASARRGWRRLLAVALCACAPLCGATEAGSPRWIAPPAGAPPELIGFHPRVHGDWIAVGARHADGEGERGALHLFRRIDGVWTHAQRLTSPAPSATGDAFGANVAFAGDWLVVGDLAARRDGISSGAAHVYRLEGETWTRHSTLVPERPRENGGFGAFVDIDGDTLMVGEAEAHQIGGWADNRAVHVFALRAGVWRPDGQIAVPDDLEVPAAHIETARKQTGLARAGGFGAHFDLDGDRLAVSAMGANAALIYRRRDDGWRLSARLDDPGDDTGFARTVDFDGDRLLVSALRADGRVADTGVAHMYRAHGDRWTLEQTLVLPDGKRLDMFGHWVAFDGGDAVIGAFRRREGEDDHASGAAYLFRRQDSRWTLVRTLSPPRPPTRRFTAYAVDVDDGVAVLSPGDELHGDARALSASAGGVWVVPLDERDPPPAGGR